MSNRNDEGLEIDLEQALNRKKVTEALESGEHRQLTNAFGDWWDPKSAVCWAGLCMRVLGLNRFDFGEAYPVDWVAVKLGLPPQSVHDFIYANDCGCSFWLLAEEMKRLPPPIKMPV
ncbi:MAG TPA: hypothetical protein VH621_06835 [Nitrososphaera sp.]|jgi:hypothetical protein